MLVVCTDLSGKERHRQVGMDRVMTSRSPGGVMISTLVWDTGGVGSNPALGATFPISLTPMTVCTLPMNAIELSLKLHVPMTAIHFQNQNT